RGAESVVARRADRYRTRDRIGAFAYFALSIDAGTEYGLRRQPAAAAGRRCRVDDAGGVSDKARASRLRAVRSFRICLRRQTLRAQSQLLEVRRLHRDRSGSARESVGT